MFKIAKLVSHSFDWETSLSLANACKLSYHPPHAAAEQARAWGFDHFDFIERDRTQVFVAHASGVTLIAFRGTDSVADWIANFDFVPRNHPLGGKVHNGFMEAFELVRDPVAKHIATAGQRQIWLTGHSLGGAIATLAAAELSDHSVIAGIQTFGQPRLGRATFADAFNNKYWGRFFRFVNDDDIVPRVPPILDHVGTLVHFQAATGWEETLLPSSEIDKSEPQPLTEGQFKSLQDEIRAVKAERAVGEAAALEGVESSLDATMEGFFPGFADHRIDEYIAAIQRRVAVPTPLAATLTPISKSFGLEATAASPPISALVRVRDPKWQPPAGIAVHARFGSIYSVQGPREQINYLVDDPNVASIEESRDAGLPELTVSVPYVGGDVVQRPPIDERGDRALMGLIDTGIDVLHETFLDDHGKTRILAIWDQGNSTGPTPFSVHPTSFPNQDFGTLYLKPDIDHMVTVWRNTGTPPAPRLRDPECHGTHVASIAAGRAVGSLAAGMAPEARLLVVIPSMRSSATDPRSIGYSGSHAAALEFLVSAARVPAICASPSPIVINVSLGMNAGAHDGSSLLEAAFDGATGGGRVPGVVIVKSAGNERGKGGHTRAQAPPQGAITDIAWTSSNDPAPHVNFRPRDYLEFWFSPWLDLEFVLKDTKRPVANASPRVSASAPRAQVNLGGNDCLLELQTSHPDNGDSRLVVVIERSGQRIQPGVWTLEVGRQSLSGVDLFVDGWVERDEARAVSFLVDEENTTLSIPGTAKTVIAVAACSTEVQPRTVAASSYGPDRKARPKPEVTAPGQDIVAAYANRPHDTQATVAMTGTSMAAPHCAGAIALALSQRAKQPGGRQLSANQIALALTRSARGASGSHTNSFGYGVLNAVEFLKHAARL